MLIWHAVGVSGVLVYSVSPPVREYGTWVGYAEEDDYSAEREARVEGCGEDVVVLGPPGEEVVFDEVVEDEVYEGPAGVVYSRCCTS